MNGRRKLIGLVVALCVCFAAAADDQALVEQFRSLSEQVQLSYARGEYTSVVSNVKRAKEIADQVRDIAGNDGWRALEGELQILVMFQRQAEKHLPVQGISEKGALKQKAFSVQIAQVDVPDGGSATRTTPIPTFGCPLTAPVELPRIPDGVAAPSSGEQDIHMPRRIDAPDVLTARAGMPVSGRSEDQQQGMVSAPSCQPQSFPSGHVAVPTPKPGAMTSAQGNSLPFGVAAEDRIQVVEAPERQRALPLKVDILPPGTLSASLGDTHQPLSQAGEVLALPQVVSGRETSPTVSRPQGREVVIAGVGGTEQISTPQSGEILPPEICALVLPRSTGLSSTVNTNLRKHLSSVEVSQAGCSTVPFAPNPQVPSGTRLDVGLPVSLEEGTNILFRSPPDTRAVRPSPLPLPLRPAGPDFLLYPGKDAAPASGLIDGIQYVGGNLSCGAEEPTLGIAASFGSVGAAIPLKQRQAQPAAVGQVATVPNVRFAATSQLGVKGREATSAKVTDVKAVIETSTMGLIEMASELADSGKISEARRAYADLLKLRVGDRVRQTIAARLVATFTAEEKGLSRCQSWAEGLGDRDARAEVEMAIASVYYREARFDEARKCLSRYVEQDNSLARRAGLMLALCSIGERKPEAALAGLKKLAAPPAEDEVAAKAQFLMGWCLLTGQKYTQARAEFRLVVERFPRSAYAKKAAELNERLASFE